MAAPVSVEITTVSADDTLHFSGSGTLTRDERGTHLTYSYENDGVSVSSQIHLGLGRAVIVTPSCRLLLDPDHPTQTQLSAEGITLPLTVETHRVHADLQGGAGTISMHYTLLAQGRPLQSMRVALALAPTDKERTL